MAHAMIPARQLGLRGVRSHEVAVKVKKADDEGKFTVETMEPVTDGFDRVLVPAGKVIVIPQSAVTGYN